MNPHKRRLLRSWLVMSMAAVSPDAMARTDDADLDRSPAPVRHAPAAWTSADGEAIDRIVGDYVEAFNSGEPAIAAFYTHHADRPHDSVDVPRWARTVELAREYRPIDVHSVTPVERGVVSVLARSGRTGEWLYLTLLITPAAPHRLVLDRVDPRVI